ncbi:MAG: FAD-dependent oxidoreductase, partial [Maioricimonas sp. JB045]
MDSQTYDVVVIGTGPGGEGAAMQATKLGKSVAVVERFRRIGGNCTHRGTIPSKALRFAVYQVTSVLGNKLFRDVGLCRTPTFPELRRTAASVIEKQVDMRLSFYERNGVPLSIGHGQFKDANTLEVLDEYGGRRELKADSFIIATGSRPYRPADIDFSHPRVFDSDTILDLDDTPRSITIYGAGVIGCEYASMFRNLGVKVNLINTRQKLLEFLDDEIIDALSYHLRDRGVIIRHNESYERV